MRNLLIAALLLKSVTSGVRAQAPSAEPWTTETITSGTLGERTIFIATPEGYRGGTSAYPILIALDANDSYQFRLWIAQAAYLADNSPGLPQMIVVGIANGRDRIHDMTPPATGSSVKDFKNAGGAPAFADYIVGEVLPYVRSKYRTVPTTILAGHSAGGLFALDAAAHKPDAFQGVIAMSPAIWFNDGTLVDIYADLLVESEVRPRLFLSNGGIREADVEDATKRFAQRLNSNTSLKGAIAYRPYADLTHSLTPLAFADGLRFIFEPVSVSNLAVEKLDLTNVDAAAVNEAISSSERTYAAAARSLRLPERLRERVLNRLGYRLLNGGKAALAIAVFERNAREYPESVNVYDSLADAFLATGNTESALAQLRTAVDVARRTGISVPSDTQRKLDALAAKPKK